MGAQSLGFVEVLPHATVTDLTPHLVPPHLRPSSSSPGPCHLLSIQSMFGTLGPGELRN